MFILLHIVALEDLSRFVFKEGWIWRDESLATSEGNCFIFWHVQSRFPLKIPFFSFLRKLFPRILCLWTWLLPFFSILQKQCARAWVRNLGFWIVLTQKVYWQKPPWISWILWKNAEKMIQRQYSGLKRCWLTPPPWWSGVYGASSRLPGCWRLEFFNQIIEVKLPQNPWKINHFLTIFDTTRRFSRKKSCPCSLLYSITHSNPTPNPNL